MAPGHAAQGCLAGLATAPLVPAPSGVPALVAAGVYVAGCTVGALVPDLDHPHSKLTHALGPVTWAASWLLIRLSKAVYGVTRGPRDYPHTNGHRTLTHTPAFAALAASLTAVAVSVTPAHHWTLLAAVAMLVGCLAHLVGDSCTNSGIPWLWPLLRDGRRWGHYGVPRRCRFDTGGGRARARPGYLGSTLTAKGPRPPEWWANNGEHLVTTASLFACVVVPLAYAKLGFGW